MVGGSQGAQVKLSDGSVKTVTAAAAGHLSKPGTTTLRMTGGVITAASSTPSSVSTAAAGQQQASFTALMFFCFMLPDSWVEITCKKGTNSSYIKNGFEVLLLCLQAGYLGLLCPRLPN